MRDPTGADTTRLEPRDGGQLTGLKAIFQWSSSLHSPQLEGGPLNQSSTALSCSPPAPALPEDQPMGLDGGRLLLPTRPSREPPEDRPLHHRAWALQDRPLHYHSMDNQMK